MFSFSVIEISGVDGKGSKRLEGFDLKEKLSSVLLHYSGHVSRKEGTHKIGERKKHDQ